METNMSIGKKEVKLLIIFGVLVYALFFYLLFINNYLPEIREVNKDLSLARKQEQALKDDLKNIEEKRQNFEAKNVVDERIENYIYNSSDVTDCISYMEKLEKLMNNKLTDVRISAPTEKSTKPVTTNGASSTAATDNSLTTTGEETATTASANQGQKYYEMAIDFKSVLNYEEVSELLNYLEGGTRRIRVSKFEMSPSKKINNQNAGNNTATTPPPQATAQGSVTYDITMTINMYAVNIEATNKLYEYSKSKFGEFGNGSGTPFMIAAATDNNGKQIVTMNTTTANNGGTTTEASTGVVPDIIVDETGYYTAGANFRVYGFDKEKENYKIKTSLDTTVQFLMDGSSYKIFVNNGTKNVRTYSGTLPGRDINVSIRADIPNTKENNNLKLNFKVINNTSYNVKITVTDTTNRVNILERSGSVIHGESKTERVKVV